MKIFLKCDENLTILFRKRSISGTGTVMSGTGTRNGTGTAKSTGTSRNMGPEPEPELSPDLDQSIAASSSKGPVNNRSRRLTKGAISGDSALDEGEEDLFYMETDQ